MNIFLIGYRATGKTTVGRLLAQALGWPLVDIDALIVGRSNHSINRIVSQKGWPAFRRMEKKALAEASTSNGQVVATGGGIVLDADNVKLMKQTGRVVLLKAGTETIRQRMRSDDKNIEFRPALTAKKSLVQEIRSTLSDRMPLYEAAMDFFIETDTFSTKEVARAIVIQLRTLNNVSSIPNSYHTPKWR